MSVTLSTGDTMIVTAETLLNPDAFEAVVLTQTGMMLNYGSDWTSEVARREEWRVGLCRALEQGRTEKIGPMK